MSGTIEQEIVATLRALPPEKQRAVLEYVENLRKEDTAEIDTSPPRKTIWQKIDERMKQVSPETLAELPADASENLDHYLYGAPKK